MQLGPHEQSATRRIGVPKEIKPDEYRVGLVFSTIRELATNGHEVAVEQGASLGAGISDQDYQGAGARIVSDADQSYSRADLVVKVKEPLAVEQKKLRPGQIVFHLPRWVQIAS